MRYLIIILGFICLGQMPAGASVAIYGDSRTGNAIHEQIAQAIIKTKPKTIFHTGDLVEHGLQAKDWAEPMRIVSELQKFAEFFPALGNHEEGSPLFGKYFHLPNNGRWYSINREGIRYIVLDSNVEMGVSSPQYQWLKNDLKSVKNKNGFIVVLFHHPIINSGKHAQDEKGLKPILMPLFEKYGVSIVFNGHDHHYARARYHNIYYIVTGGGGAPLYDQTRTNPYVQFFAKRHHFCQLTHSPNHLKVKVFDQNLNVLDEFVVEK